MLEIYLPILVVIGIAFAFAIGSTVLSRLIGVKKPSEVKLAPYECGISCYEYILAKVEPKGSLQSKSQMSS